LPTAQFLSTQKSGAPLEVRYWPTDLIRNIAMQLNGYLLAKYCRYSLLVDENSSSSSSSDGASCVWLQGGREELEKR